MEQIGVLSNFYTLLTLKTLINDTLLMKEPHSFACVFWAFHLGAIKLKQKR